MCPESFVRTVQTQFGKMESKSLLQQAATRQHRFQRGHEAYRSRSKLITTLRRPRAAFTMPPLENLQNTTVNTSLEILQDWQQGGSSHLDGTKPIHVRLIVWLSFTYLEQLVYNCALAAAKRIEVDLPRAPRLCGDKGMQFYKSTDDLPILHSTF